MSKPARPARARAADSRPSAAPGTEPPRPEPAAVPRPDADPGLDDGVSARMLARRHTVAAVATLAELLDPAINERVRMAAALGLLERGWGKVGLGGDEEEPADAADPEEARARLADRIERLAAAIQGADEVGA